jgi:hypothetical protein
MATLDAVGADVADPALGRVRPAHVRGDRRDLVLESPAVIVGQAVVGGADDQARAAVEQRVHRHAVRADDAREDLTVHPFVEGHGAISVVVRTDDPSTFLVDTQYRLT